MVACATILNAICLNGTRVLINIYVWYMYIWFNINIDYKNEKENDSAQSGI